MFIEKYDDNNYVLMKESLIRLFLENEKQNILLAGCNVLLGEFIVNKYRMFDNKVPIYGFFRYFIDNQIIEIFSKENELSVVPENQYFILTKKYTRESKINNLLNGRNNL